MDQPCSVYSPILILLGVVEIASPAPGAQHLQTTPKVSRLFIIYCSRKDSIIAPFEMWGQKVGRV